MKEDIYTEVKIDMEEIRKEIYIATAIDMKEEIDIEIEVEVKIKEAKEYIVKQIAIDMEEEIEHTEVEVEKQKGGTRLRQLWFKTTLVPETNLTFLSISIFI